MDNYGAGEYIANLNRKGRGGTQRKDQINKSKTERLETFVQAMLYVAALLTTFFFAFLYQILRIPWMFVIQMAFVPLLGFFNFFIFIRPLLMLTRQQKPELSRFKVFLTAILEREITAPSGRRGSIMSTLRRNSQNYLRTRRSSQTFVIDPTRIVQKEQFEDEQETKKEGIKKQESPTPSDVVMAAQIVSNSVESVGSTDEHDEHRDGSDNNENESLNLTQDYQNML